MNCEIRVQSLSAVNSVSAKRLEPSFELLSPTKAPRFRRRVVASMTVLSRSSLGLILSWAANGRFRIERNPATPPQIIRETGTAQTLKGKEEGGISVVGTLTRRAR